MGQSKVMNEFDNSMRWHTEIQIKDYPFNISHENAVLFMGSCFTNHMYSYFANNKFNCVQNPLGITYNPVSISNQLNQLVSGELVNSEELDQDADIFFHYDFHTHFSGLDSAQVLYKMNESISKAHSFIQKADAVFLTLGTAWVHALKSNNVIVNNCHKQSSKQFNRFRLSVKQMTKTLENALLNLFHLNPEVQVIFTISPVRHIKDGLEENNLSKSALRLCAQYLQQKFANCHYFPSYEIMMDDLRDYRFYESDLIHPNKVAVSYIQKQFEKAFFNQETLKIIRMIQKIRKSILHDAFQPESKAHQAFLNALLQDLNGMQNEYSRLDFSSEIKNLAERIDSSSK